jgi:hypothetical protein
MIKSWMCSFGVCGECSYEVVVTQSDRPDEDYCWYCSNPKCKNHNLKEHTGDQESPAWLIEVEEGDTGGK